MSGVGRRPLRSDSFVAGRLRAADAQPFLAVALFALTPIAAPGTGTCSVDERWRLYVDPEVLEAWTVEERAGVLLHEVGHLVRDHAGRARTASVDARTRVAWNLGADAEINDDLRVDGIALPGEPVYPETLDEDRHRVAEWYFTRLLARVPSATRLDCGMGAHGVGVGEEGGGDGEEVRGVDPFEAALLRHRVAEAVLDHDRQCPGHRPGGWTRWAQALLTPTVDWRRVLRGALRGTVGSVSGAADYSYRRPPRRRVPRVVLPSLVRPSPRVAVVVDTSASVDDEMLVRAWSEVHGCLRALGVRRERVSVFAGDVVAHRVRDVRGRRIAPLVAPLSGGGGTDLAAVLTRIVVSEPRPDVVVVLTDGRTPWPDQVPAAVVVALLEGGTEPPAPPAWAHVVRVPPAGTTAGDDRGLPSATSE